MAVSLVEIGVLVIAYNADSYVKTKADKAAVKAQENQSSSGENGAVSL